MHVEITERRGLKRWAILSVVAAVVTIALKLIAWRVTGSVGFFSDALESVVNLVAATLALFALLLAARPPDSRHAFGHTKVEYLAAGVEGTLILIAAVAIGWSAIPRLIEPQPLEAVGVGIAIVSGATVLNLGVGLLLIRVGRTNRSITLEANGRHLLTDVWTSGGVVAGVALVAATGIERADPAIALLVAGNIVVTGLRLVRRAMDGLMDASVPSEQLERIVRVLDATVRADGHEYHALRTRTSGHRSFMSMHVLLPGAWTLQEAHDYAEEVERRLQIDDPALNVVTHVEPIEDRASFDDEHVRG